MDEATHLPNSTWLRGGVLPGEIPVPVFHTVRWADLHHVGIEPHERQRAKTFQWVPVVGVANGLFFPRFQQFVVRDQGVVLVHPGVDLAGLRTQLISQG